MIEIINTLFPLWFDSSPCIVINKWYKCFLGDKCRKDSNTLRIVCTIEYPKRNRNVRTEKCIIAALQIYASMSNIYALTTYGRLDENFQFLSFFYTCFLNCIKSLFTVHNVGMISPIKDCANQRVHTHSFFFKYVTESAVR